MADLGKKWACYSCGVKFYDFCKPESICPQCKSNQKNAPAKPKAIKKEKAVIQIDDDFGNDPELEVATEDGIGENFGISHARAEGVDPGDLRMDDYDE